MVEVHGDVYRTVDIGEQGSADWKPGTVGRDYESHPSAVKARGLTAFAFFFGEFRKQSGFGRRVIFPRSSLLFSLCLCFKTCHSFFFSGPFAKSFSLFFE